MRQASQEWPGHEVRVAVQQRHFEIAQKVLRPLVLIQGRFESGQQCVQHQLASDAHRAR